MRDRQLPLGRGQTTCRDAVCDFAGDSRHANPWAATLYHRAIARGKDHPHATRILARAWLDIIWRCWQDRVPYDPVKHRALQTLLAAEPEPTHRRPDPTRPFPSRPHNTDAPEASTWSARSEARTNDADTHQRRRTLHSGETAEG